MFTFRESPRLEAAQGEKKKKLPFSKTNLTNKLVEDNHDVPEPQPTSLTK